MIDCCLCHCRKGGGGAEVSGMLVEGSGTSTGGHSVWGPQPAGLPVGRVPWHGPECP